MKTLQWFSQYPFLAVYLFVAIGCCLSFILYVFIHSVIFCFFVYLFIIFHHCLVFKSSCVFFIPSSLLIWLVLISLLTKQFHSSPSQSHNSHYWSCYSSYSSLLSQGMGGLERRERTSSTMKGRHASHVQIIHYNICNRFTHFSLLIHNSFISNHLSCHQIEQLLPETPVKKRHTHSHYRVR